MKRIIEHIASKIIGVSLSIVAIIFVALGATFLPIIGILISFPIFALARYFFVYENTGVVSTTKLHFVHQPDISFAATV